MGGENPINISDLMFDPSIAALLESCASIVGARVFVVDPAGTVVAQSEAGECSCATCSDPPERLDSDLPLRAEVDVAGDAIGVVCSCGEGGGSAEAVDCLAKALSMKAMDQVDLDSLSEELLSKYEEVNLVYDISGAIASVFDEKRIAERVLERVMQAIQAERGIAIVANKETGDFELMAAVGLPSDMDPTRLATLFEGGICQQVATTGKALVVDAPDDAPCDEGPLMAPPLVCSPLVAGERVIGVITLASKADGGNFTSGDLKLLNAIASAMGIAIQNARLVEEAKEQERMRRELEIAASIQSSLLPDAHPSVESIDIVARTIAAERVGGDYYGFFEGQDGCVSLVIADVSGHSIAAALMAATLRSVIRVAAAQGGSPSEMMDRINHMMYPDLERAEMLVSMFYAEYDPSTSILGFANAGHNRPILCRAGKSGLVNAPGMLLGVLLEHDFPEKSISLQRDDVVLFYTDGIVEAENDSAEPYGEERLMAIFSENASLPLDALLEVCLKDVQRHTGTESLYDDVTMIAIRQK